MNMVMAPKPTNWRSFDRFSGNQTAVSVGLVCESPDMATLIAEDIIAVHGTSAPSTPLSAHIDIVGMGWDVLVLQCDEHSHIAQQLLEKLALQPLINRPVVILQISIEALDDIFPVAESLEADILIGDVRAERIAALLSTRRRSNLAEQDEDTAFMLRRLTEQMDGFAKQLERLSSSGSTGSNERSRASDTRLASPKDGFRGKKDDTPWLINDGKTGHFSANDVRRIISARRRRDDIFGDDLFADPAWDILLDLYAAFLEERQVAVSSLCIAAAVPPTTALRWLKLMTKSGWLEREADPIDRRRVYMRLSAKALKTMQNYLDNIALDDASLL
jgi:DNA-binding MarR family transcriptional regulator